MSAAQVLRQAQALAFKAAADAQARLFALQVGGVSLQATVEQAKLVYDRVSGSEELVKAQARVQAAEAEFERHRTALLQANHELDAKSAEYALCANTIASIMQSGGLSNKASLEQFTRLADERIELETVVADKRRRVEELSRLERDSWNRFTQSLQISNSHEQTYKERARIAALFFSAATLVLSTMLLEPGKRHMMEAALERHMATQTLRLEATNKEFTSYILESNAGEQELVAEQVDLVARLCRSTQADAHHAVHSVGAMAQDVASGREEVVRLLDRTEQLRRAVGMATAASVAAVVGCVVLALRQ